MPSRYFVRAADVPTYHPANHSGTAKRRLIDPKHTGARNIELSIPQTLLATADEVIE